MEIRRKAALLLASTALAAVPMAALAQGVTLSGFAEMGIADDGSKNDDGTDKGAQFHQDLNVTFTGEGTGNDGTTFGFAVDLEDGIGGGAATHDDTKHGGTSVYVKGAFGNITLGDTDGALDWAISEVPTGPGSIAADEEHDAWYASHLDGKYDGQILRYDHGFDVGVGTLSFGVSLEMDDDGATTGLCGPVPQEARFLKEAAVPANYSNPVGKAAVYHEAKQGNNVAALAAVDSRDASEDPVQALDVGDVIADGDVLGLRGVPAYDGTRYCFAGLPDNPSASVGGTTLTASEYRNAQIATDGGTVRANGLGETGGTAHTEAQWQEAFAAVRDGQIVSQVGRVPEGRNTSIGGTFALPMATGKLTFGAGWQGGSYVHAWDRGGEVGKAAPSIPASLNCRV